MTYAALHLVELICFDGVGLDLGCTLRGFIQIDEPFVDSLGFVIPISLERLLVWMVDGLLGGYLAT